MQKCKLLFVFCQFLQQLPLVVASSLSDDSLNVTFLRYECIISEFTSSTVLQILVQKFRAEGLVYDGLSKSSPSPTLF